jgi:hypothetical protein
MISEILMAMTMKITIFLIKLACYLLAILFDPECGISKFLWHIVKLLADHTELHIFRNRARYHSYVFIEGAPEVDKTRSFCLAGHHSRTRITKDIECRKFLLTKIPLINFRIIRDVSRLHKICGLNVVIHTSTGDSINNSFTSAWETGSERNIRNVIIRKNEEVCYGGDRESGTERAQTETRNALCGELAHTEHITFVSNKTLGWIINLKRK